MRELPSDSIAFEYHSTQPYHTAGGAECRGRVATATGTQAVVLAGAHWLGVTAGTPAIPAELCQLIRRLATENPLWGRERIANELPLKLSWRVRRVRRRSYRQHAAPRQGEPAGVAARLL
jgi:hypothetical protein